VRHPLNPFRWHKACALVKAERRLRCMRVEIVKALRGLGDNLPQKRAAHRQAALDFGAQEFVDLNSDALEDIGKVDLVFDVLGGDIVKRSASVIRAGGTLVTVTGPTEARPTDGLTIDFVVVPDVSQLGEIVQRVRDGRLRTNIGNVATLNDAIAAFNPTKRVKGKTIIRVRS